MTIKPPLSLALALCVAGCSSLTTSQVDCTSLSHERQEHIRSDLDLLLVSRGFTVEEHLSDYPSPTRYWCAPLRNGNADFTVLATTNSEGMIIYVNTYRGQRSENKNLTKAIAACIQSNAPDAQVYVQAKTEIQPLWWPIE